MDFERQVFISYSHIDNQPLTSEQKGWVTLLHLTLQTMLNQRVGKQVDIWRDEKIRGNDIFSDEIVGQLPKTASIVTVLTPRYLNSEWCTKEITAFCELALKTGGVAIGTKSRIFKVIKTPINNEETLPPEVKKTIGYEFYDFDEDHTPIELNPAYGDNARGEFLRKANKLAWDIAQLLAQLQGEPAPVCAKPLVYLAECCRDLRESREILLGELESHGYAVLPDQLLPIDEKEYLAEVDRLLARCKYSIHLIGRGFGMVPDGTSQKSVVVLQNELAAQHSRSCGLPRLIWIQDGTLAASESQKAFIESLHQDADMQLGADLITGDIEELKGAMHAALKNLAEQERKELEAQKASTPCGATRKMVYILCDAKDLKEVVPLLKFLKTQALEVQLPLFTGDAAEVREANQELLLACDAVILFYGSGDEAWKYHQESQLRKSQALRPGKAPLASYLYLADPSTDNKEFLLCIGEPNLIDCRGGFQEVALKGFLAAVGAKGATP